ncbi:MAG: rhodanese-like domain-containing protein [Bacilli bacterium]
MNISILSLLKIIDKVNIIDIRSIEKYNDNHIQGSKNIPMLLLLKDYSKYLEFNIPYYIYCQRGINSFRVCQTLMKKGYHVINVLGGYEEWLLQK